MNVAWIGHPSGTGGEFSGALPRGRQRAPRDPGLAELVRASSQKLEPPERPRPRYSAESFARTVRPLMGPMVHVARRILGDDVQAWDAVQEALIRLWDTGEIPPNPRAWLTRAVVLRSLHQARSRARRRRHELRACDQHPEASDRDDPSRRLECEELERTLDEALRTIPEDYRAVILLRTAAQMDYASIADALQIPIGTVRSRLNRTRQIFREVLAQTVPPDEDVG